MHTVGRLDLQPHEPTPWWDNHEDVRNAGWSQVDAAVAGESNTTVLPPVQKAGGLEPDEDGALDDGFCWLARRKLLFLSNNRSASRQYGHGIPSLSARHLFTEVLEGNLLNLGHTHDLADAEPAFRVSAGHAVRHLDGIRLAVEHHLARQVRLR